MNCPHCETEVDEHEANRCLDAWVAEAVMGLAVVYDSGASDSTEDYWQLDGHDYGNRLVPPHSTDIAAAWGVVGRFSSPEYLIDIQWDAEDWRCYIDDMGAEVFALGPTAPLAICRAALKAVYVGEDDK